VTTTKALCTMHIDTLHPEVIIPHADVMGWFRPGDIIRLSASAEGPPRAGRIRITQVDHDSFVLYTDAAVVNAVPSACKDDWIFVEVEVLGGDTEPRAHLRKTAEESFERKAIEDLVTEANARDFDNRHALISALLSGVRRADWHLVSDMANDLRVLEARR